ncbi:MAG: TetR/AcrR family transcriptional regulator [Syntrophomonadaceae bacterium]|nr:TetR/AcrR family transcriptional regulator [Syntrophomonadaceae bacterium]
MHPHKKQEDINNSRQKIIDTATALVMERGVKGTSLADIASAAGISKGTLFYHFSAKDDLIYELTEKHFDKITRANLKRAEQMQGCSLQEILQESLLGILQAENRGKLNLYLLQEAVIENPALKSRFADKYVEFQNTMIQFLNMVAPPMDNDKAIAVSRLLVAVLDGLIIQWLLDPDAIPVKDIAAVIAQIINNE